MSLEMPLTYEQLEAFVDRLPELYRKHGFTPERGGHHGKGCAVCALEVISVECGLPMGDWPLVTESMSGCDGFWRGFDGRKRLGSPEDYYELGQRAARLMGLEVNA